MNKELSLSLFIVVNYDIYMYSIKKKKKREDVAYFFVIKGEQIFNSNSD